MQPTVLSDFDEISRVALLGSASIAATISTRKCTDGKLHRVTAESDSEMTMEQCTPKFTNEV